MTLRVLELYAGIGGCAAALDGAADVVGAIDHKGKAEDAYQHNFPHPTSRLNLQYARTEQLAAYEADLWWMSPPCQPYTRRGKQQDLDDPRAASFLKVLKIATEVQPRFIALENVEGFERSRAWALLREVLGREGYTIESRLLCPTAFGVPNRRPRFYAVASLEGLEPVVDPPTVTRPVRDYLDPDVDFDTFAVDADRLARFERAMLFIEPADAAAITACFTSAYTRSPVRAGSFLRTGDGARHFTPREILRLLHFPDRYALPREISMRDAYRLVGNSLSVLPVRAMLRRLPPLAELPWGIA